MKILGWQSLIDGFKIFRAFSIAPVQPLPAGKATYFSIGASKHDNKIFWASCMSSVEYSKYQKKLLPK